MQLSEYLNRESLTHQEFAERIGTSQATVSRYVTGARFPEQLILRRICEATQGVVTANDFVNSGEVV